MKEQHPSYVRYCPVSIQPPSRLKDSASFNVYAVYAREINVPEGCEPVEWMLLTSECVTTQQEAEQILRWYTYRWRIEEYHKILKSGGEPQEFLMMRDQNKPSPQEELYGRIDQVASFKERLEQEIQAIMVSSAVAPGGCWIARYLAKGRKGFY